MSTRPGAAAPSFAVTRAAGILGLDTARVAAVAELLGDGATIPFIARYRKERTGELDEEVLRRVQQELCEGEALVNRRERMIASLAGRGLLTGELRAALQRAQTSAELEDLYLPYRPRRRTRAAVALEAGLGDLAHALLADPQANPEGLARGFVAPDRGVDTVDEALAGARDVIAQTVADDPPTRTALRELYRNRAVLESSRSRTAGRHQAPDTFRDYFDHREPAPRARAHRVLAMLRGEREGVLVVHARPPERDALDLLARLWGGGARLRAAQLELALGDAYRRLLDPSLEGELKKELFERASEDAARVFADNLADLLLAPPLGSRRVLAVDPGFRTGSKVVCLDERGGLQHHEVIYPLEPRKDEAGSESRLRNLVEQFRIQIIAVGNGTGGRETVEFLERCAGLPPVVTVNESGASVYSASPVAREEFPEHDVTVRGAVSIGRRLMDPLAELVKVEPRALGVGQYQHDVDERLLESRLEQVVEHCVNRVGVELNTASVHLLRRVSGLTERVARAIVEHREKRGGFVRRSELRDVPGVGERTYELAAGFLRLSGGPEPLDATGVHPERYALVRRMAADAGVGVAELVGTDAGRVRFGAMDLSRYVRDDVGMPTLRDIAAEIAEPGRDPRARFEAAVFRHDVRTVADLRTGMRLPGVVTNVTDFGAFVDVGVHRDGLVHISRMSDRFIRSPRDVVRVGLAVDVTVVEIDVKRNRISLSMID